MIDNKATNYYERLVRIYLTEFLEQKFHMIDEARIEDIVCIALNKLPPRYFHHEIDMAFYLGNDERELMEANVREAVSQAVEKVKLIDQRV